MRSNKFHDALRRPAFDLADQRGNNPHGTREQAEAEGRRLNGYRYETVSQVERALDARARQPARHMGEANPPPAPPPGGGGSGGGNGLFWLLAAGAGIALLSALASSSSDVDDEQDDDGDGDGDGPPLRENPAPAAVAASPNITVNLTMPHGPPTTLVSNPLPPPASPSAPSEPIHVTVPVMAPVVLPPPEPVAPPALPAAPLLNPEKKRRRSKVAG